MPELPEVQTVAKTLKELILNDTILGVEVYWDNIIDKNSVDEFKKIIVNQKITDIKTYGKIIVFILDDYAMLSHLRMEGKYYVDNNFVKDKHSHVIFKLKSNRYLRFHDVRKFGKLSLINLDNYHNHPYLLNIGKEPFEISVDELYAKLQRKDIEIKAALLDQKNMSGLGNIYVDEVLFRCKINPTRKASQVSKAEVKDIIDNSIDVLNKAIALGGTTIRSYTSSLGVSGKFQNDLLVHTKKDEPCVNCGTKISKIKVKGRGTYLCLNCQKK